MIINDNYSKNISLIRLIVLLVLVLTFDFSCIKNYTLPVLTTEEITEIYQNNAISGGNVTDNGGGTLVSKGVCWKNSENPEITDSRTIEEGGSGSFISIIEDLTPNTLYYVRAYAKNKAGIAYGNQVSFTTSEIDVPALSTAEITSIKQTSAVSGGNIISENGSPVTEKGVCWGPAPNPTILSNKQTHDGFGKGPYLSNLFGLEIGTISFVRAYAINEAGIGYGNSVQFETQDFGKVPDVEGNIYKTIAIGTQTWFAENLKSSKYRNREPIETTIPATLNISTEYQPKYQWGYDGDESNISVYGRLYTWYVISDNRGICPEGWHVPTDVEWRALMDYLGGDPPAYYKLRETGTSHWSSGFPQIINDTGFTALPGGCRSPTGSFNAIQSYGLWWSSTEADSTYARTREFGSNGSNSQYGENKKYGLSIRCLKDN